MPKSPSKRSPKDNSGKQSRSIGGKEQQEEHGWRHVLVWVIPLAIAFILTFISLTYSTHRLLAIWAAVGAGIAFLLFVLFLAEWYVWKEESQRAWPRRAFGLLCAALIVGGFVWQYCLSFPERQIPPVTSTPTPTPTPALPTIGASPSTATNGREFLDIDPEKLFEFFEKYNDAQAEGLVKPYIGKWMDIQGRVIEVRRDISFDKDVHPIPGIKVTIGTGRRQDKKSYIFTQAYFDEQRWMDRAFVLKTNETIKVRGQLRNVFARGLVLEHCEIIE